MNKRRGWNAYFPMPFRKSARVELVYDGPLPPGEQTVANRCPATATSCTARSEDVPDASRLLPRPLASGDAAARASAITWPWRPRAKASSSAGTSPCRQPGEDGYPVDQNEKFFIDGEARAVGRVPRAWKIRSASVGASPRARAMFPLTGLLSVLQGRVRVPLLRCKTRSASRSRSRVAIGFGKHEDPSFGGFQPAGEPAADSRARSIGIRSSRTRRCPPCPRPPSALPRRKTRPGRRKRAAGRRKTEFAAIGAAWRGGVAAIPQLGRVLSRKC